MMLLIPFSCAILFCSKFYYILFKYKGVRCSIWIIITKPLGADYRRPARLSNQIICLSASYYCHSLYQSRRNYTHLHQQNDNYTVDSVSAATAIVFYDDPFNLTIQCIFLLGYLPEPPEGAIKSILSLALIRFVYLYPLVRSLILNWSRPIFVSFLAKDNWNVFV